MKTGLIVATSGLVALLVTVICLARINDRLASENRDLRRQLATLRGEFKLAREHAAHMAQDAIALDTELGATKRALTEQRLLAAETEPAPQPPAPDSPAPTALGAADERFYQQRITDLEQQLTALLARAIAGPSGIGSPLPAEPKTAEVLRVSPDETLVVLAGGANRGLHAGQILLIQRGTTELARVQITDVRPRLAVARVLPGSLKGKLQTGDQALLTL